MSVNRNVFECIVEDNLKVIKDFKKLGHEAVTLTELQQLKKKLEQGISYIDYHISAKRITKR